MSAAATTDCPPGFKIHTENSAKILLPDEATAFLNPIQEFNRDLSVACITTWSKRWDAVRRERWEQGGAKRERGKKKRKGVNELKAEVPVLEAVEADSTAPVSSEDAGKTEGGTNGNAPEQQKEASRLVYRISLIFIN